MIYSDSTGPLTLPLSGYPNPEQSSEAKNCMAEGIDEDIQFS